MYKTARAGANRNLRQARTDLSLAVINLRDLINDRNYVRWSAAERFDLADITREAETLYGYIAVLTEAMRNHDTKPARRK